MNEPLIVPVVGGLQTGKSTLIRDVLLANHCRGVHCVYVVDTDEQAAEVRKRGVPYSVLAATVLHAGHVSLVGYRVIGWDCAEGPGVYTLRKLTNLLAALEDGPRVLMYSAHE